MKNIEFEDKVFQLSISLKKEQEETVQKNELLKNHNEKLKKEIKKLLDELKFCNPQDNLFMKKKYFKIQKQSEILKKEIETLETQNLDMKRELKKIKMNETEMNKDKIDLQVFFDQLKLDFEKEKKEKESLIKKKNKLAEEIKILIKFIIGVEKSKKLMNLGQEKTIPQVKNREKKESVVFSEFEAGTKIEDFLNQCEADFYLSPKKKNDNDLINSYKTKTVKAKGSPFISCN